MKRLYWLIGLTVWLSPLVVEAVPDTTLTIAPTAVSGSTITASDENSRNNTISTSYNAHSHTDLSTTTANTYTIGNNASGAKSLAVDNQFTTSPSIRYLDTSEEWQVSHNATTFARIGSQAKTGNFTRDTSTATGTQAVTGVGFKPIAAVFFATQDSTAGEASWGMDAGSGPNSILDNYSSTANSYANGSVSIYDQESTTTNNYQGTVSSFDNDGFTISWTKAGSPTGTLKISYIVWR